MFNPKEMIKQQLKNLIDELNKEIERKISDYKKIDFSKEIACSVLSDIEDQSLFLRYYLNYFICDEVFSSGLIEEIKKIIINNSSNHLVEIADYNFVCEYGFFYVYKKEKGYSYQLDTIEYLDNEYFRLSNKGEKIQQVTVFKQDLPITIRNYQKNDKIELRYGTKKVNRFFIDRKIRKKDRDRWPVMVNKENEVIFVSGIGCDVNHYTTEPNLFVIK